ncbi:MAG: PLD nuclease N-terminal domain-containing protein [Cellulomonas sp.]
MNAQLADLSTGVRVFILVAGVIQLTLDVVALVDLVRRPVDRVAMGNKWIWVAIILLVNLLGAILYLVAGRKPEPAAEVPLPSAPSASRTASIADSLYGRRDGGAGGDDPGSGGTGPAGTGPDRTVPGDAAEPR